MVQFKMSSIKANEYINSAVAKRLKADGSRYLHYDIEQGESISVQNLLSVILYCDWTDLSTRFSSTFWKTESYESIESIKKNNREYAIWSKLLRETVQFYGNKGYLNKFPNDPVMNEKWNVNDGRIKGPFYCGLSAVMVIPKFNIRLCGPTSTSKQLEVAMRFGGDNGMIMTLQNDSYHLSRILRGFNCSWLSNYPGLFLVYKNMLKIYYNSLQMDR